MKINKILMIAAVLMAFVVGLAACESSRASARSSPLAKAEKVKHTQGVAVAAAFGTAEVQAPAVAKLPQYDAADDIVIGQPVREVHVRQSADAAPFHFAFDNVPIERTAKLDGYTTAQIKPKISYTGVDNARAREKV